MGSRIGWRTNRYRPAVFRSFTITENLENEHSSATVKCEINGFITHATVDSGAGCSIISSDVLNKIKERNLNMSKAFKGLIDASGNNMDAVGSITLKLEIKVVS